MNRSPLLSATFCLRFRTFFAALSARLRGHRHEMSVLQARGVKEYYGAFLSEVGGGELKFVGKPSALNPRYSIPL